MWVLKSAGRYVILKFFVDYLPSGIAFLTPFLIQLEATIKWHGRGMRRSLLRKHSQRHGKGGARPASLLVDEALRRHLLWILNLAIRTPFEAKEQRLVDAGL